MNTETSTETRDSAQKLAEKIDHLRTITDLDRVLTGDKNSFGQIKSYFKINRLAYRVFHSAEGFMHFRVSQDGEYHDADVYYQPDRVEALLPRYGRALELGFGQGANLFYLAKRRPDAFFCGVDIGPTNPPHHLPNLRLFQRNSADLSNFPDNSFDVVYAIETIVYSTRKDPIFREAYRVLKPGGVFVVYDYQTVKELEEYDETGRQAVALLSKGGACAMIESVARWERYFQDAGFQKRSAVDLAQETLPDLARLEQRACHALDDHPFIARRAFRVLPRHFVNNIIIGYIGYDACRAGIGTYMECIYEKSSAPQTEQNG